MCGIVAIAGKAQVATRLVDGLNRLEYRGYDSEGIAVAWDEAIERRRARLGGTHAEAGQREARELR